MTRKIFTIGYGGRRPQEFVDMLVAHGVDTVVDVRIDPNRGGMGAYTMAKSPDKGIVRLLGTGGIGYESLPELGNPYRDDLDWPARYEQLLAAGGEQRTARLRELSGALCLLCAEKNPDACHRTQVAEYMQAKWGWSFEALM